MTAAAAPSDDLRSIEEGIPPTKALSLARAETEGAGYKLEAVNISYSIKVKNPQTKAVEEKTLIHPVSFSIKPKKMLAIMGASGAGKSTMLDILATRIPRKDTQGEYLMNGNPVGRSFKRVSGYVMQDDALYPLLTVRETLQYAAQLRITGVSKERKFEIAEETIKTLKLEAAADTIIGDDRHRGLSGGEKRRVSIGVDIVHQPSIIFLDEPTSGLDSTTALQIVETLKEICSRNRTVAMTIHQPSARVFESFHSVMFMSKGHMVYHDSPLSLGDFITNNLKKELPKFCNLPEVFLEIVSGYEKEGKVTDLVIQKNQSIEESFRSRKKSSSVVIEGESGPLHADYANNFITETAILLHRNARNILRTPELFFVRLFSCVMMGAVIGSLFNNVGDDAAAVQQVAGYVTFFSAFYIFTSLQALPIFLNERSTFHREHGRGAYRVSSYVAANALIYLPFFFVMSCVFTIISFYMLDLPTNGSALIFQIVMSFLLIGAANGCVTFLSAFVPDALIGNEAGTTLFAFMFLFGGFFMPKQSIPKGWIWMNTLSLFRYPFEGMMVTYLRNVPSDVAEPFYESFDISGTNQWQSVWVLVLFYFAWRFLFYLVLRFKHTGKR